MKSGHGRTAAPIVVGIDGSDDSLCAAGWAAEQAGARNLPLRIVVAADSVPAEGPDMAVGSADQLVDRVVERVRECVPDVTCPHRCIRCTDSASRSRSDGVAIE
jgi:nucleotide-binding universal stress UspA family protein